MKLTNKTSQAITNLQGNPNFRIFVDGLTEYLTAVRDECCSAEGNTVYRAQGKHIALREVLKAIEQAPDTLEKFKT